LATLAAILSSKPDMKPTVFLAASTLMAVVALAAPAQAQIERRLERTFTVAAGHTVDVEVSGGSIRTSTGTGNQVQVTLTQVIHADSDRDADDLLRDYDIHATQSGDRIEVVGRRKSDVRERSGRDVSISATLVVPATVLLDLQTSGGSIDVRGARTAAVKAHTSGGSVSADGGSGAMDLGTSGGSIDVHEARGTLRANTSGGSIDVDFIGPNATDVSVHTSGGGIRIGIDPAAKLSIEAGTSGGSVSVDGLNLTATTIARAQLLGTLNGGGGRLSAATSGGSVRLRAASR
jgi:hypothetical protein